MADIEFRYNKSPQWRAVTATGAALSAIGGASGLEFHMRFTYEWVDIVSETAPVDVTTTATGATFSIKGPPKFTQTNLFKIEEVAIRMHAEAAVGFAAGLLIQFSQLQSQQKLTEDQKKKIRDAFATFEKS
jgi:hypothetical protein